MAYEFNNLVSMYMGPKGSRVFRYSTTDAAATVQGAGYFNDAVKHLSVGDVIMATVDIAGTAKLKNYVVLTNDGSAITVGLQTTTA